VGSPNRHGLDYDRAILLWAQGQMSHRRCGNSKEPTMSWETSRLPPILYETVSWHDIPTSLI